MCQCAQHRTWTWHKTASLKRLWSRRLIALVKALLGSKPVVVVESKEAKNAKPGEGALDLQNEQKRDDQTKRRRFQQKCLAVVRGFVCLPEASECSALQVCNAMHTRLFERRSTLESAFAMLRAGVHDGAGWRSVRGDLGVVGAGAARRRGA